MIVDFGQVFWLGLDYAGVDVALRRLGYGDGEFRDIQVMEIAATKGLNEKV